MAIMAVALDRNLFLAYYSSQVLKKLLGFLGFLDFQVFRLLVSQGI